MISGHGNRRYSVWTVGHSNRTVHELIELLKRHEIKTTADIRSAPYSRYNPQFNRRELEGLLGNHGIGYRFLGAELGGRPRDRSCYDADGRVIYDELEKTREFRSGIEAVKAEAERGRLCLLCSEEDPAVCHRALSVGYVLTVMGVEVRHIRGDGSIELQADLQGKTINRPVQFSLFEEVPPRKSLQPVSPESTPSSSSGSWKEPGFGD